jgi:hypothetical protein
MIENMTLCEYYISQGYVLVPWHYFDVVAAVGFAVGFVVGAAVMWVRRKRGGEGESKAEEG